MTQHCLILSCKQNDGHSPLTIRQTGIRRILHRPIITWTSHAGHWGQSGAGFFALELAETRAYHQEFLVLTLFGAAEWLLLDGHWLAAHPNQYTMQRPLFSFFGGDQNWDEISSLIIGAEISQAMIADNHTQLILNKARTQQVLELPENTSRLPLNGGTLKPKNWPKTESQLDAWVVTTSQLDVD
jgi:hypothetical protein